MEKRYTVSDTARLLKVNRQTIIYWMKKGWVHPRRDYRDWPVFTESDIRKIVRWRNALR
ncbi:MAG TPA: MerR family transcriptional regulator [Candidatus Omnitrophota bacterium]|nr:MerR family transcriptional regulator [Candidatus Omnitrophota bacterium]